jgi:hypothetical protein
MTQIQSNDQWSGGIAAHPILTQKIPSAKIHWKVLASIFWDQDGILLIDYVPNGQTINMEYYSYLLAQLKDILKEKHFRQVRKWVLFLHDNVPASGHLQPRRN